MLSLLRNHSLTFTTSLLICVVCFSQESNARRSTCRKRSAKAVVIETMPEPEMAPIQETTLFMKPAPVSSSEASWTMHSILDQEDSKENRNDRHIFKWMLSPMEMTWGRLSVILICGYVMISYIKNRLENLATYLMKSSVLSPKKWLKQSVDLVEFLFFKNL